MAMAIILPTYLAPSPKVLKTWFKTQGQFILHKFYIRKAPEARLRIILAPQ
jgi:hypothetical protein